MCSKHSEDATRTKGVLDCHWLRRLRYLESMVAISICLRSCLSEAVSAYMASVHMYVWDNGLYIQ